MSCICNCLKLPKVDSKEMVRCIKINMSNGEQYVVKQEDMVAIQFVKDDKKILVRRGRVKDIVVVNQKMLHTIEDNVSRIILDCSEQFSIKIIEIKLKDIIKIGGIDDEFYDYSDRIVELNPNFMDEDGCKIPVRHDGMCTEEEMQKKITKPGKENVCKMNATGEFDDLYTMNKNRPQIDELRAPSSQGKKITRKGIRLMR